MNVVKGKNYLCMIHAYWEIVLNQNHKYLNHPPLLCQYSIKCIWAQQSFAQTSWHKKTTENLWPYLNSMLDTCYSGWLKKTQGLWPYLNSMCATHVCTIDHLPIEVTWVTCFKVISVFEERRLGKYKRQQLHSTIPMKKHKGN